MLKLPLISCVLVALSGAGLVASRVQAVTAPPRTVAWALCDGEACTDSMSCVFQKTVIPTPRTVCTFSIFPGRCENNGNGPCKRTITYGDGACTEVESDATSNANFCGLTAGTPPPQPGARAMRGAIVVGIAVVSGPAFAQSFQERLQKRIPEGGLSVGAVVVHTTTPHHAKFYRLDEEGPSESRFLVTAATDRDGRLSVIRTPLDTKGKPDPAQAGTLTRWDGVVGVSATTESVGMDVTQSPLLATLTGNIGAVTPFDFVHHVFGGDPGHRLRHVEAVRLPDESDPRWGVLNVWRVPRPNGGFAVVRLGGDQDDLIHSVDTEGVEKGLRFVLRSTPPRRDGAGRPVPTGGRIEFLDGATPVSRRDVTITKVEPAPRPAPVYGAEFPPGSTVHDLATGKRWRVGTSGARIDLAASPQVSRAERDKPMGWIVIVAGMVGAGSLVRRRLER